jgi:hypothetical protein
MKRCAYCGCENDVTVSICKGCGNTLPKAESTGSPTKPVVSGPACPACGGQDYKEALALRSSFSWLVIFAGGFLAVLFHNASREERVQCNACGHFFGIRTPMSRLSLIVFWFLIAPTVLFLACVLVAALFRW